MLARYLASHQMTQRGQVAEARQSWKTPAMGDRQQKIRMAFRDKGVPRSCPVEGCPGRAATRTAMWVHFLQRNVLDTAVILKEEKSSTYGAPDVTCWSPNRH